MQINAISLYFSLLSVHILIGKYSNDTKETEINYLKYV